MFNLQLVQTQHFFSIFHPNSNYITTKLYRTSSRGCNNSAVMLKELFTRRMPAMQCNVAIIMSTLFNSLFLRLIFRFCLTSVSNIITIITIIVCTVTAVVKHLMRNRAEKVAVRWCHLTHQFIAGGISS